LRVQVLEEDAERDQGLAKVGARCMREGHQGLIESGRAVIEGHRFALSVALGLGTGAPWDAIHERLAELLLRLLVDEAQPPAPRCMCGTTVCESDACDCDSASCPVDHADEAQQDGARS
jgi:hypothetical protein